MTTTQTRTAAAAIITLIVLGLLIATPAGTWLVQDVLVPDLNAIGEMFHWLFAETLGSAWYTISGLLGELGELFSSIF